MPIRFRCTACRRLLAIARRKAGTLVKCPKCRTELTVPTAGTDVMAAQMKSQSASSSTMIGTNPHPVSVQRHDTNDYDTTSTNINPDSLPLFERPDFESLLNPALKQAVGTIPSASTGHYKDSVEQSSHVVDNSEIRASLIDDDSYDLEPVGLVISKTTLTAIAVTVVVLIGMAFAAGYLFAAARLPSG